MSREAMTLALDALEHHTAIKHPQQSEHRDKAITALRAALDAPGNDYERGFVDGMQEQMKRSVDQAVMAMSAKPMTKKEWMAFLEKAVGEFDWEAAGHKREWVGLTEIEICDLEVQELPSASSETFSFARAIEAKLKEKNQ
jgi:hypothetical protein